MSSIQTEVIKILKDGGITLPIFKLSAPIDYISNNIVVNSMGMASNEIVSNNLVNINVRTLKKNGIPDTATFESIFEQVKTIITRVGKVILNNNYLYLCIDQDPNYFDDNDDKFFVMNIRILTTETNN